MNKVVFIIKLIITIIIITIIIIRTTVDFYNF